jgi:hypothetical protein
LRFITTLKTLLFLLLITFFSSFLFGGYVFTVHNDSFLVKKFTKIGNSTYNYFEKRGIVGKTRSILGMNPKKIKHNKNKLTEKAEEEKNNLKLKAEEAKRKLIEEAENLKEKTSKTIFKRAKKMRKNIRGRLEEDIDITD